MCLFLDAFSHNPLHILSKSPAFKRWLIDFENPVDAKMASSRTSRNEFELCVNRVPKAGSKLPVMTMSLNQVERFQKTAIWLSWFTIAYNILEGVVAITFGIQDGSVALAGFGLDSFVEVASAFLVLWRFKGETSGGKVFSLDKERKAAGGIGVLFLLLAGTTVVASAVRLSSYERPHTSLPGLIISVLSLSFMFFLWQAKRRVAIQLDSATVMNDAQCSLACIKLSLVLFLGSLLYLVVPAIWWADGVAAILLAGFIGKEGFDTLRAVRSDQFSGGCGCS